MLSSTRPPILKSSAYSNFLIPPGITRLVVALLVVAVGTPAVRSQANTPQRWPIERAKAWLADHGWLRGCNFVPSTAINQIEMWQPETFDEKTIDIELGYAEQLGFNSIRVFLHDLLWEQDRVGFCSRIDRFLQIAESHHIGVVFVIFDSCWDPQPKLGRQRAPVPLVHNSGWVQSPGLTALTDSSQWPRLEAYVMGLLGRFGNDRRIVAWDLYNEPDNWDGGAVARPGLEPRDKFQHVNQLLQQTFLWARRSNPSQPVTSGVWRNGNWGDDEHLNPTERIQLENSDVISFHCYENPKNLESFIAGLCRFRRPLLCTEFMARPLGSTFDPILRDLRDQKIAAYCWGFVSGKTQTIFPWDSWTRRYTGEPTVWFHDILRPDGTPYRVDEVDYIRRITGNANPALPAPAALTK